MSERNIDFDKVIDRKGTSSLKYDFAVRRGKPADVLPLWVADMDFPTSSEITDVLVQRAQHGIFGYTETDTEYFEAVSGWMLKRHGWKVEREWMLKTPGVVFAIAMAVKAYTKEGEGVLIQQPVYYPFTEVIRDNNRVVVNNALVLHEDGRYYIDFEDFEKKITDNNVKLFLLCSPHNPVGRVWSIEELTKVGNICARHGVIIVSDEIHEDFVYGKERKHNVFANISEEFAQMSITCTSPGKTFNLAGLQVSNIFIPNRKLKAAFRKQLDAAGYSQLGTMGIVACEAAYRYGGEWYEALMQYLEKNLEFVREYLRDNLPKIKLIEPEGTYLVWLDFRALHMTEEAREDLIVNKAGLWLDSGAIFGADGEGFERINIACPKSILLEALERIKKACSDEGLL